MATAGKVEAVEVYTVNEPCGFKTIEYKVLEMKSLNLTNHAYLCCIGAGDVLQGEDQEPVERLQVGVEKHQGWGAHRAVKADPGHQVTERRF